MGGKKSATMLAVLALSFFAHLPNAASAPVGGINVIKIKLEQKEFDRVVISRGKKEKTDCEISVNGAAFQAAEIGSRGQSCLIVAKRPCLSIKLENKVEFIGSNSLSGKAFNLASMWQDRGYLSSKLGFEMFRALGIFDLRTEYVAVWINDKPYGLYLATEKPKKAIDRIADDAWIGRRGYKTRMEVVEKSKGVESKAVLAEFAALNQAILRQNGGPLKRTLESKINLKRYMQWLLVNSLLKNGDYADEVFFYVDPKQKQVKFDILPWDFDDLFKPPHAGADNQAHAQDIENGLLYGYENPLDVKIGLDPVLNEALKVEARELFGRITPEIIRSVFGRLISELAIYAREPEVLSGGRSDSYRRPYTGDFFASNATARERDVLARLAILKSRAR